MSAPAGRVLLASHHAQVIGGGELSLLELIKGLSASGWRPTLVTPEAGELSRAASEIGIEARFTGMPTLRRPSGLPLRALRDFRALVRELRPDIVHANGSRAMFYAGLGARATRCPAVWHLRIITPEPLYDLALTQLAAAVITTSQATRDRLRKLPGAFEKCRVIPNGIDLSTFIAHRSRADVRSELGLAEGDLAVMSVGRLVDFKRFDLLLDAVAQLSRKVPRLRCVVVGTGPAERSLRERGQRDGIGDRLVFTGHRDDVADLLEAADVFVMTSPVEAFGRVIIEAMASSLPVVAPNAGGAAEIVVEGETGLLVPPERVDLLGDAIEKLCGAPALRDAMGAAGRQRVERSYSMKAHTRAVIDLYDALRDTTKAVR